jgi:hypothetical protein
MQRLPPPPLGVPRAHQPPLVSRRTNHAHLLPPFYPACPPFSSPLFFPELFSSRRAAASLRPHTESSAPFRPPPRMAAPPGLGRPVGPPRPHTQRAPALAASLPMHPSVCAPPPRPPPLGPLSRAPVGASLGPSLASPSVPSIALLSSSHCPSLMRAAARRSPAALRGQRSRAACAAKTRQPAFVAARPPACPHACCCRPTPTCTPAPPHELPRTASVFIRPCPLLRPCPGSLSARPTAQGPPPCLPSVSFFAAPGQAPAGCERPVTAV